MIQSFFQNLEKEQVGYLLISGQAAILYGAATFSEDIDIWVRPNQENIERFLFVLEKEQSEYYKLTPPMNEQTMLKGHGFHYLIPYSPPVYLDVMGKPPRVSDFTTAQRNSQKLETPWGIIPTVGIKDLIKLKTTQRLADYETIGRLVFRYLSEKTHPSADDLRWAVENIYTLEDLRILSEKYPESDSVSCEERVQMKETLSAEEENRIDVLLSERMLKRRQEDRTYWQNIIEELKILRSENKLMPVGQPVTQDQTPE